ncbi:hypothetical protein GOBAR_AA16190 [Gossypium barbadense]|uniref:C2 domain-containing protein n=1 Tax=Gossypium barbadense TaxID=3634 RepID=A0A2P5XM88_GOSBA|nr:hypothetical protein GOBAR_AA16190 [Gossypium barbadense]
MPAEEKEGFSLKETKPNIGGGRTTPVYSEMNKPNPEWNQVFAFTKDRIQSLPVEIPEFVNNEFIGKIAINVSDIRTQVPLDSPLAPEWYKLEDKDMDKANLSVSELMLVIWFGTQADEVFIDAWHSYVVTVYLSPRLWYLRVNIIEAQDLVNRNSEVYVKGTLGNVKLRTRVSADKSFNPRWNDDLMFVAADLGRCMIHLSEGGGDVVQELKFASKLNVRISLDGATFNGLWPPALGVLELGIVGASVLVPMKSRVGPKWSDSFSPKCNEQYTWKSMICLRSKYWEAKDQLFTLPTNQVYTYSYPLIALRFTSPSYLITNFLITLSLFEVSDLICDTN